MFYPLWPAVCVEEDPHLGTHCILMRDLCMKPHHIHNTLCKEWAKGEWFCAYSDTVHNIYGYLVCYEHKAKKPGSYAALNIHR